MLQQYPSSSSWGLLIKAGPAWSSVYCSVSPYTSLLHHAVHMPIVNGKAVLKFYLQWSDCSIVSVVSSIKHAMVVWFSLSGQGSLHTLSKGLQFNWTFPTCHSHLVFIFSLKALWSIVSLLHWVNWHSSVPSTILLLRGQVKLEHFDYLSIFQTGTVWDIKS